MSSEGAGKVGIEDDQVPVMGSRVKLAIVFLRLLAFCATTSAMLVMALNKQTKTVTVATIRTVPITATLTAKFQHTPAFVFFVIANANASLHNLLMLGIGFIRPKWSYSRFRGLVSVAIIPLLDLANVGMVSGGATAAAFMGQLGREGNSHAKWNKICDKFGRFCDRGGGAIIASYVGLMLLIIICSISIVRLRNHA